MRDKYLDGSYSAANPTWDIEDSLWKVKQIEGMLTRNGIQPNTIGEVGCGAGEILNQLYIRLPEHVVLTGYDISPQALALCRAKEKDRLSFQLSDVLEESNIFFDLVLAIDVIEHVEDYFAFLRGLKGKGTYKLFHIPLDLSVQSILRGTPIIKRWHSVGHIHLFTKETALASLRDTGYEILDYCFTAGGIEANKRFSALLLRFPRMLMFSLREDLASRLLGGFSLLVLTK